MTFKKDFFETFSDQIDRVVHLADKSQLKPSRIGSIRLKLSRLVDYILSNVLYVPHTIVLPEGNKCQTFLGGRG